MAETAATHARRAEHLVLEILVVGQLPDVIVAYEIAAAMNQFLGFNYD